MSAVPQSPAGSLDVRPLGTNMAAEVVGLDLSRPLSADLRQAVYDAFVRYQVLAFRNQDLTPEQQVAFTEHILVRVSQQDLPGRGCGLKLFKPALLPPQAQVTPAQGNRAR